jgi:glutamyl-tRNA synthetase
MLDSKIPKFGHFPLIKSISGEGLSKRTGKNSINQLRSDNILPIIIINYLSKIGTSKSIDNILDKEKLIDEFDLKIFSKNSIFFDLNELLRLNSKYLKELGFKELKKTTNLNFNESFWEVIKSNVNSIEEAKDWYKIINSQLILEDKVKLNNDLKKIILAELPEKINSNTWVDWTKKILEKCDIKPKELYTKLRIILTGKQFGPSMNNLLTLLNVKEIVNRIKVNSE